MHAICDSKQATHNSNPLKGMRALSLLLLLLLLLLLHRFCCHLPGIT
jgi:hypothetical protein